MPRLPKIKEYIFLHSIISKLVVRFGRDNTFNFRDILSGGEGEGGRQLVAAVRDLPEPVVIEHLREWSEKGWIRFGTNSGSWTFQVTDQFPDLPDMQTPDDIIGEKMTYLSNQLSEIYPDSFELLKSAQQKLISASKQHEISEIGNLCVQYWESFTDKLWMDYMTNEKPPKDQTQQKITPIVEKYIQSKTSKDIYNSLGKLFDALMEKNQKVKHGTEKQDLTIRDAKIAVVLSILLSEEILYGLVNNQVRKLL